MGLNLELNILLINNLGYLLQIKRGPTYEFLYPSGTNLGILYGLPKVHKANWPIRPILSAVNTPNYLLAKYLVPNLTPLTKK